MTLPFRLMSYNSQWLQEFEQSRSSILQATEGWIIRVEHIGSTAVHGSIARPIVDLIAGIQDLQGLNEACELIEGINFKRIETPDWCEDELCGMLIKPRSGDETHSVLVVNHAGRAWQRAIQIRDRLASNMSDLQELLNLKQDYFQPGCTAAEQYANAKDTYFRELEERIRIEV